MFNGYRMTQIVNFICIYNSLRPFFELHKLPKNWNLSFVNSSLRELMHDLTVSSYKSQHHRPKHCRTNSRFANYTFVRSNVPETLPGGYVIEHSWLESKRTGREGGFMAVFRPYKPRIIEELCIERNSNRSFKLKLEYLFGYEW